jgi:hypothetical protein
MAEDKQVKKYFENMPYGKDSKSSEIHGKKNQVVINQLVEGLVRKYDEAMADGNKGVASHFNSAIKQIARDLDNLKSIKEEFAMNYGGGTGGKNVFSNYTNLQEFDRPFFIEQGEIGFDNNFKPILSVMGADGQVVSKKIEDITQDWVVKGTGEADFMKMQQDAQKQSNTVGQPLDFDVDWAVDSWLGNEDQWKSAATDKVGGRYFLHDYLQENEEAVASGEIPDEMLHPESFNPDFDMRLHKYYANRLKKAFDPDFQTPAEARKADELIAQTNPQDNAENTQS